MFPLTATMVTVLGKAEINEVIASIEMIAVTMMAAVVEDMATMIGIIDWFHGPNMPRLGVDVV